MERNAAQSQPIRSVTPFGLVRVALVGAIMATMIGAEPLASWADQAADDSPIALVRPMLDRWHGTVAQLGLDRPYAALHALIRQAESLRFPDRD
jgi:hypothetical protein